MAELINSIILTSGTVIKIPIFPVGDVLTQPSAYNIYTRSGGVLCEKHTTTSSGLPNYMAGSADDIVELCNILVGTRVSSLNYNNYTVGVHNFLLFFWAPDGNGNPLLSVPFEYNMGNPYPQWQQFPNAGQNVIYYNNYNADGNNFYTVAGTVSNGGAPMINIREGAAWSIDQATKAKGMRRGHTYNYTPEYFASLVASYNQRTGRNVQITAYDPSTNDDPYIIDDPSTWGGGNGSHEDPDITDKASIPALPTIGATDTGLVTMYGATNAQLQSLGGYLWSNLWDIDTNFKKLYSDPMDCLVGLSILPCTPTLGVAQNVKFGNITTNIALNVLSSQYVEVDCGSVAIKEYIGCFLDYSPYVNISIYLPYVGYRELSPDDVMNDTVHVVYHVDCLTGACTAMLETANKGLLYSYNGSCSCNVPLTAINYSGAIQNAVSAVGAGLTTVAGAATGAAPIAAMGAVSMLSNAANTAINSKPTVQRSGAMGGAAGLMSNQKPMLVITRPRKCVPDKLNKFIGLTTHVTMNLSQCKGFTQIELIHLDNVPCTDDERDELLTLLTQGVIF